VIQIEPELFYGIVRPFCRGQTCPSALIWAHTQVRSYSIFLMAHEAGLIAPYYGL